MNQPQICTDEASGWALSDGADIAPSIAPCQIRPDTSCRDRGQPFAVTVRFARHAVEKSLLQFRRDRPALPLADDAIVELANRRHLGRGAGEESLVRDVDLIARDALRHDGDSQVAGDTDDRIARDALE